MHDFSFLDWFAYSYSIQEASTIGSYEKRQMGNGISSMSDSQFSGHLVKTQLELDLPHMEHHVSEVKVGRVEDLDCSISGDLVIWITRKGTQGSTIAI
jgi:hypothetical protein